MSISLNNHWTFDLYIGGLLYAQYETREECLSAYAEYKRNLRYGRAA